MAGFNRKKADPKRIALVQQAEKAAWQVVLDRRREGPLDRDDERDLYMSVYNDYMRRHAEN